MKRMEIVEIKQIFKKNIQGKTAEKSSSERKKIEFYLLIKNILGQFYIFEKFQIQYRVFLLSTDSFHTHKPDIVSTIF